MSEHLKTAGMAILFLLSTIVTLFFAYGTLSILWVGVESPPRGDYLIHSRDPVVQGISAPWSSPYRSVASTNQDNGRSRATDGAVR